MSLSHTDKQIQCVTNFNDLISTPFHGNINTICWTRVLVGDFSEIVDQVELNENIVELDQDALLDLQLSEQGQLARDILLNDLVYIAHNGYIL